ncbi:hypothetical protein METHB2_910001 [Candidatus Methylobacter favarea]|uniref:Uncharacterized protein n=1 Tax=Candidatus Methylobacter favarea TaxID=2707345 RepID=A0A8S0WM13_9GAMM|nr:hypothetical protein METHB2_910001 [Candidatus Methylobacter favarea]
MERRKISRAEFTTNPRRSLFGRKAACTETALPMRFGLETPGTLHPYL